MSDCGIVGNDDWGEKEIVSGTSTLAKIRRQQAALRKRFSLSAGSRGTHASSNCALLWEWLSCTSFRFPLESEINYYEGDWASDKTLCQWDLTTGQCVITMDILWAISHRSSTTVPISLQNQAFHGSFSVQMQSYADGTREFYEDFVRRVQFWGYGLVSGGAIRMWDSEFTRFWIIFQLPEADLSSLRTGQIH